MKKIFRTCAVFLAFAGIAGAAPASAAQWLIEIVSDGTVPNLSFVVDKEPTPDSSDSSSFTINDVQISGDVDIIAPVTLYNGNSALLLSLLGYDLRCADVACETSLFSGPTSDPVIFLNGLTYYQTGERGRFNFITITDYVAPPAGVPEPATWAMLLIGFMGVGAAMRRRARPIAVPAAGLA